MAIETYSSPSPPEGYLALYPDRLPTDQNLYRQQAPTLPLVIGDLATRYWAIPFDEYELVREGYRLGLLVSRSVLNNSLYHIAIDLKTADERGLPQMVNVHRLARPVGSWYVDEQKYGVILQRYHPAILMTGDGERIKIPDDAARNLTYYSLYATKKASLWYALRGASQSRKTEVV